MPVEIIDSKPLRYAVRVPSHTDSDGPRPVICFLHGYDEAATHTTIEEGVTRHGPLNARNPADVIDRFVIVAPQLPMAGDLWWRYTDSVCEAVGTTINRYNGDHSRCYLTGFSFGGNGVFDLAGVQPALWTALWAVDPTRVPRQPISQPVWISSGDVARYLKDDFTSTLQVTNDLSGNRVWLDQRENHVGSATRAYQDVRIYDWLLEHRF